MPKRKIKQGDELKIGPLILKDATLTIFTAIIGTNKRTGKRVIIEVDEQDWTIEGNGGE